MLPSSLPTRLIVVGSANVDLCMNLPELPGPGETLGSGVFRQTFGGKGANAAVAAAQAGGDVALIGCVGQDSNGEAMLANLRAKNVDISHIEKHPTAPTGVAFIFIDQHAQNMIGVAAGSNDGVSPERLEAMRGELSTRAFTRARTVYFQARGRFAAPALPGAHNQANMEAALALCAHFGVTERTAREAMAVFTPAGHRLERVGEKGGVLFIDDSKATTVEALRAAIQSCDRPVRLLAGGVFKGGDLEGLVPLLRERVRSVGLFGASREIFEAAWAGSVALFWEPKLEGAVRRLYGQAGPGETILLSPATASFDLYSGYKARGDDFQRIFRELPGRDGEGVR